MKKTFLVTYEAKSIEEIAQAVKILIDHENVFNMVDNIEISTAEPAKPTAEEFLLWMQSQCNTPCHQCKMLKACNSNSDMCFGSVDIDLVLKLYNERAK